MGEATYPGIVSAIERRMRAVLRGIIEGEPPLQVGSGRDKLTTANQGGPQGVVRLQKERRVVGLMGQAQKLFSQRKRPVGLPTVVIKPPEGPQHGKELGSLPHLPTQLLCPGVCLLCLRCCRALGDHQCRA
jgi:hypothetical protein